MGDSLSVTLDAPLGSVDDETGQVNTGEPTPTEGSTNRPEGVPEKFWDAESGVIKTDELLSSYNALESKLGQPPADPSAPIQDPPAQAPEGATGLQKYFDEYSTNGTLSEDSYKALEETHKLNKADVDQYISDRTAGVQAAVAARDKELVDSVGGKESFDQLAEWARQNLTQEEIRTIDAALGGDTAQAKIVLQGVQARRSSAVGISPRLIEGKSPAFSGVKPFGSIVEQNAAIMDPRYKSDPSWRKEVTERMMASPF